MKCLTVIIQTILLMWAGIGGYAQDGASYLVRKVVLKEVPVDATFSSLQQDKDGFMWLGGLSGLYRYDGTRVTRFLRDPADSNSLTHNYANTLASDSAGNIWIGTFGGFMNKYDRRSAKIIRIEQGVKSPPRTVVFKTRPALNGNIIAATARALYKITVAGNVIDSVLIPAGINLHVNDFLEYATDQFIIAGKNGLFLLNWKTRIIGKAAFSPGGTPINVIEKDADNNFWLGTDSGLVVLNNDFSFPDKTYFNGIEQLSQSMVKSIKKDAAGNMWMGTNAGLYIYDHSGIQKIAAGAADSLKNINQLFIDNSATTWVSTTDNGLYQVYQPGIAFKTIPGMQKWCQNKSIQSIWEEGPGTWLIGTKAGLFRYRFSSKQMEELSIDGTKNKWWIGAQLIDKNNGYWVGTFGQGVFYRAPGTNDFIQFTNRQADKNFLPYNTIVAFAEDMDGNIWMGSFNDGGKTHGLCYYNPHTKQIRPFSGTADEQTFKATDISQIETDNNRRIWIGTWDRGLYRYNGKGAVPQENNFTYYAEASAGQKKISHQVVSCVKPGKNGRIWFGTISGGLNVLDTKTDSVIWFTVKNGMPSNLIYRIEEDEKGILWMSTDNGIARFDPLTKSFINYNTSSGLPANNFAFLSSVKCKDGSIAFGTDDGQVVYFNPGSSENLINTLPVIITDIKLFNTTLQTGPNSLLHTAAYLTDTLLLKHDQSVISFELSNMDFLNAEMYTYAYKLEGFDKTWNYISDRNSITYTNLDPGTYRLQIKNANHLGIWNETPASLVLIVQPPFWQTWWFICLVLLAIAGLIYSLFRYRLQQQLRVLQVRNRLHRDLHDDVGATLSSVKAYSEILRDKPDNPVIAELIKDNAAEMLERLEIIAWATSPEYDNFKSLKSRMTNFAAPLCQAKNIHWQIDTEKVNEEMQMPGELRQNIFLVFKEAINNMIKYAGATTCNTHIFIKDGFFCVQVRDNGKGFDGTTKGTGNGWKNMKKRAADLNGGLMIDSIPQNGTVITMRLPYPFKIPAS